MFKGKRWIQIRYGIRKGAYFIHNNRRYYLNEFMRANNQGYHGYLPICNFYSMVIKLNDSGEAVKVDYQ